jgi:hypothetical protein
MSPGTFDIVNTIVLYKVLAAAHLVHAVKRPLIDYSANYYALFRLHRCME